MTREEREKAIDEFLADPEKHKREWLSQAHLENPKLTHAQLLEAWEQARLQFGF